MANWHYYNEDREKVGPIISKQLKKLAKHGIVLPETVIETDDGRIGLARDVQGLVFGDSMPMKATLRPHNEVGVVPPDTGEIYGLAMSPEPLPPEPSPLEPSDEPSLILVSEPVVKNTPASSSAATATARSVKTGNHSNTALSVAAKNPTATG